MKIAVFTAPGLGDGLLMMTAAEQLHNGGHEVTVFNNYLPQLSRWFPHHTFCKQTTQLDHFDQIVLQYENSPHIKEMIARYRDKISVLYCYYDHNKYPPLTPHDIRLNPKRSLVNEIPKAIETLFKLPYSTETGITLPKNVEKTGKQVAIHPCASSDEKRWPLTKFVKIAALLKKKGYTPFLVMSPSERERFKSDLPEWLDVPLFQSLDEAAMRVAQSSFAIGNDSGILHLASALLIPTLVIAAHPRLIIQWGPGWEHTKGVITPPSWVPNLKGWRLRDKYWKSFIPTLFVKKKLNIILFNPK